MYTYRTNAVYFATVCFSDIWSGGDGFEHIQLVCVNMYTAWPYLTGDIT